MLEFIQENRGGLMMRVRESLVSASVCAETGQVLRQSRGAGMQNTGTQSFLCGLLLDVGTKWVGFCPVSGAIPCIPSGPRKSLGEHQQ